MIEMNYEITLTEKIVADIYTLRQLPTENYEQRTQYIDLYRNCYQEIRKLGYIWTSNNIYSIITDAQYPFSLSKKQTDRIKSIGRGKCAICGFNISAFLTIHHIIPRSCGGNDNDSNLVAICPICHKIMHMIVNGKTVQSTVDLYIKRKKLTNKLHEYTAHLDCDYFDNLSNTNNIIVTKDIDNWIESVVMQPVNDTENWSW